MIDGCASNICSKLRSNNRQSDRSAFLSAAVAGDETLRREVEALLAAEPPRLGLRRNSGRFASDVVVGGAAERIRHDGVRSVPASPGLTAGSRLGNYDVPCAARRRRNGRGVPRTRHQARRDVAIKILPRLFTGDADRLARFDREARMLAALNHPHIGAIYGVVDIDGTPSLVLELIDGETLADRIARGPSRRARAWRSRARSPMRWPPRTGKGSFTAI